jgi:hypothetical protein
MNTKVVLISAALVLSGCADSPRLWGEPEKVLFSNADTIQIEWNNWQRSEGLVRAKAVLFCEGRRVEEVGADRDRHTFGIVRSKTWRCVRA